MYVRTGTGFKLARQLIPGSRLAIFFDRSGLKARSYDERKKANCALGVINKNEP
jgi:hypothetical protein